MKCMKNRWHSSQIMTLTFRVVVRQSYDDASVMSGRYNSFQAKLVATNNRAVWISCAAHSLNLVGRAAAECCQADVALFDFLGAIYVFFTVSYIIIKFLDSLKTGIWAYVCSKQGFYNTIVLLIQCSNSTPPRMSPNPWSTCQNNKTWKWDVQSTFWSKWSPRQGV